MKVKTRDIMTTDLITVSPDTSLSWVDDVMDLAQIRHLPVVDEGKLVGLITQRDLLTGSISALAEVAPDERQDMLAMVQVCDLMQTELITASPGADVAETIGIMLENKVGCLPVVDDDGQLVGLITDTDLMKLAYDYLSLDDFPGRRTRLFH